ncbi:hypothetical protein C0214_02920 [Methylobacterium sp. DM1]|nr:hypothetical protein C0214_02920 [Methylobacterium sp. DM1]
MDAIGAKPSEGSAKRMGNANSGGARDYGAMTLEELQQVAQMAQEINQSLGYVPEPPKKYTGEIKQGLRIKG